jgi:hypothetical protein
VRKVENYLREKLLLGTLTKEQVEHIMKLREKYDINEQVYQEILNKTSGLKTLQPDINEFSNHNGAQVSEILENKDRVKNLREHIKDLKQKTDSNEAMYQKMVSRISRLKSLDTENGNGYSNGNGSNNGIDKSDTDPNNGSNNSDDTDPNNGSSNSDDTDPNNGNSKNKEPGAFEKMLDAMDIKQSSLKNDIKTKTPKRGRIVVNGKNGNNKDMDEIKKILEDL